MITADVTAEELFNMFFGGGFPSQNVYVRRQGRWQRAGAHAETTHQREVSQVY
jgi:DnaJ family protein B protein 12